ncbi:LacI family transcriptional regulator [Actinomadura pelletieri DSM 43383]|uniref:LacI family transcriptional regulator n=1 Tax=Actinomadura pelletieri DSM 43383 TaxID=1120940 RepID=A0A495QHP7_9ACTN|nr:LacI family DNA-binding transcriptional regulator [Actinomadura pelletieri]RKS71658.1 LacI family transcriptional regulator [Actinomadura pelletieri DSM 43383]
MSERRKRATIREVAQATGLSPAAVSYALRGMQTSEETQERVRAAAAELGYEAHPIARALASGRTDQVGLLCGSLEDYWQQSLAVGIGRALLARGRYALIVDAGGDPERELALARRLRDQRVDGLIVQPLDPSAALWAELSATVPVVSIGDALNGGTAQGEVVFDNRRGVTLALEHLRDLGHRRLTVFTSTRASTPDRPADVHVNAEAERLGLRVDVVAVPEQSLAAATEVARRVLDGPNRPTAVFCFADSIAYGVYAATRELGLDVPGDIAVCGYDDHPMSALLTPPLTTVDWDIDGIVESAVQLVVDVIDGEIDGGPRERRVVRKPSLRVRASTGERPG